VFQFSNGFLGQKLLYR